MWAGTNAGYVYIYQITLPADDRRDLDTVDCILAKEIHLKHQAPVVSICVIDRNAMPLPAPLEVQHECARPPDMTGGHSVVICSEEQLKTFTLPSLGTRDKFKLTAHEGSKVRRVGYVNFRSRSDGSYMESDIVCLTNTGEVHVYSIPHLRRQLKADCVTRENIIGIVTSVFTQSGEGFYLISPSEFARFSVSAHITTHPMCLVRRRTTDAPNTVTTRAQQGAQRLQPGIATTMDMLPVCEWMASLRCCQTVPTVAAMMSLCRLSTLRLIVSVCMSVRS
jgi:lethal(2) giant larvae protein